MIPIKEPVVEVHSEWNRRLQVFSGGTRRGASLLTVLHA